MTEIGIVGSAVCSFYFNYLMYVCGACFSVFITAVRPDMFHNDGRCRCDLGIFLHFTWTARKLFINVQQFRCEWCTDFVSCTGIDKCHAERCYVTATWFWQSVRGAGNASATFEFGADDTVPAGGTRAARHQWRVQSGVHAWWGVDTACYCTPHTHTHPFNGPLSGTTRVSRYQKGKTNLDFTEARDSERQWRQLGHIQVCTLLQTDNHASTPPLSFLQVGCCSWCPTNSIKALKALQSTVMHFHHHQL